MILEDPGVWVVLAKKGGSVLLIILVLALFLKLSDKAKELLIGKNILSRPLAQIFYNIVKTALLLLALLVALQQFGLSIANLWTVITAAVAMIAIGFVAVWSVLSNILCTIMLLIFRPFRIGDEVEVIDPAATSGVKGIAQNVNLFFTTLRCQEDDEDVVIQVPNNLFFQKLIKRKAGRKTFTIEKQLFAEKSLLKADNGQQQP